MSVLWEYFQHNPLEKVLLYALEVCLALEEGGGALSVKNREKNNSDKIRRNGFKCLKRERERIV